MQKKKRKSTFLSGRDNAAKIRAKFCSTFLSRPSCKGNADPLFCPVGCMVLIRITFSRAHLTSRTYEREINGFQDMYDEGKKLFMAKVFFKFADDIHSR